MNGVAAAVSMLACFLLLIVGLLVVLPLPKVSVGTASQSQPTARDSLFSETDVASEQFWHTKITRTLSSIMLLLINVVAIFAVNMSYVDAVVNNQL